MSDFGAYSGKDFLALELKPRNFLVDKIIREKDSVILVGNEKSGKSLLTFQLICSLTTQHPFLDKFEISKPCKVTYIQLEGELGDSQDRFKRMIKTLDFNPENFQLMFYPPLELQDKNAMIGVLSQIKKFHIPDILIIDPIYFAFMGSLSDDEIVRKFIGNIRVMKDNLGCAVILVHHTHKMRFTQQGDVIIEGDEAIFGSKFFKAWADHTMLFIHDQRNDTRAFSCNTQRSGDIIKQCHLKLNEPDPLYFEEIEQKKVNKEHVIIDLLFKNPNGFTIDDIAKKLDISRQYVYGSIKNPLSSNIIIKDTSVRPIIYKYNSVNKTDDITLHSKKEEEK